MIALRLAVYLFAGLFMAAAGYFAINMAALAIVGQVAR